MLYTNILIVRSPDHRVAILVAPELNGQYAQHIMALRLLPHHLELPKTEVPHAEKTVTSKVLRLGRNRSGEKDDGLCHAGNL